jgi:hypothetical protein
LSVDGTHFRPRNKSSPRGDNEHSVIKTFNPYSSGILRLWFSTTLRIAWYSLSCSAAVSYSAISSVSSPTIIGESVGSRNVSIAVYITSPALPSITARISRVSAGIAYTLVCATSTSGRSNYMCRSIRRSSCASFSKSWSRRNSASARSLSFLGT